MNSSLFAREFVRAGAAFATIAVAACAATTPLAPPPPPPPNQIVITIVYRPEDFAWSSRTGPNAIKGSSPKGYSCAGLSVGLTPDAPYSRERIAKLYGSVTRADRPVDEIRGKTMANDNPDLARFVRRARCDATGHFSFAGLPDGGYFLITPVAGPNGPLALMRHVALQGGHTEPVALTIRPAG